MGRCAETRVDAVLRYRQLKSEGALTNAQIAKVIGVPWQTLYRWHCLQARYEDRGLQRPRKGKPGPKRRRPEARP